MATRTTSPNSSFVNSPPSSPSASGPVLGEEAFQRILSLERKRSERSQRPFVLLLIDAAATPPNSSRARILQSIVSALQGATRETDVTGWYTTGLVVGVIFTEILVGNELVINTILQRISAALGERLSPEQFGQLKFSFHTFPDNWDPYDSDRPSDPTLYPDLEKRELSHRVRLTLKRAIDILGSSLLLALLSPLLLFIAAAIRLTSKGGVLFQQKRIGQHGTPFTFLKFRSMYVNNDASEHKEYVRQLIAGQAEKHPGNGAGVFKLTNDPRITPVGRFLRRSSLDELPQLINVLRGEMSLVGPRPPVPYEVEAYSTWHRRRLLEAKPGITGLWQVHGRSRVEFDEMVRLDLRYARNCSPWLDVKILLQTPKAVIGGDGAC